MCSCGFLCAWMASFVSVRLKIRMPVCLPACLFACPSVRSSVRLCGCSDCVAGSDNVLTARAVVHVRRRRKGGATSGWGEPADEAGSSEPAPIPEPIAPPRRDSDDDDGVAAFIPDLEEEEQEEQIREVSEAPAVQHQMQSIDELDNGADAAGALHMIDHGIDLSLLTGCLSARGHVEEEDTSWDFNGLLSDVSQELQKEVDKQEAEEEEEG